VLVFALLWYWNQLVCQCCVLDAVVNSLNMRLYLNRQQSVLLWQGVLGGAGIVKKLKVERRSRENRLLNFRWVLLLAFAFFIQFET